MRNGVTHDPKHKPESERRAWLVAERHIYTLDAKAHTTVPVKVLMDDGTRYLCIFHSLCRGGSWQWHRGEITQTKVVTTVLPGDKPQAEEKTVWGAW